MRKSESTVILFILITTVVIFLLACLIVTLLYLYKKRQTLYSLNLHKIKSDFDKNILSTKIEIQEQTLMNISREIHDNINLSLILVKLNLTTLSTESNCNVKTFQTSISLLSNTIENLNNLSKSMNPELVRTQGLLNALECEIGYIKEVTRLKITKEIIGNPTFLNAEKELIIFRIIQEAFNNAIKHSLASEISLCLNYSSQHLTTVIKDNGVGFCLAETQNSHPESLGKSGLVNMKTRAGVFGGSFHLETQKNVGTKITITIPY